MAHHNFYIYSNCDFSAKSAAATRMRYYASAIADDANHVYLVSCCSNKLTDESFVELEPNIFVHENKKLTRKMLQSFSFLRDLNKFSIGKTGGDTFFLYPYPFFFLELMSVLYLIFFKKKNVYYELNEVKKYGSDFHAPFSFKRPKYSLQKLVYKVVYRLMDYMMPFFKGVVCISRNIEEYGRKYNKNTLRIPILTDPYKAIETSKRQYSKQGAFNIGFSGSIIPSKENLHEFVSIIEDLQKENYKIALNLCGWLPKEEEGFIQKDWTAENAITYYGNLNELELSTFLSQQDLLVIPRGYNLQNHYGFSTKLSDYLNHKKVILVTDVSDYGMYIKDGVNGFIVPPDDKEQMYGKLVHIIENFKDFESQVIANALKTSKEKFDYRIYSGALRDFLK